MRAQTLPMPSVHCLAELCAKHGLVNMLEGIQRAYALLADQQMGGPLTDDYVRASNATHGLQIRAMEADIRV